MRPRLSSLLLPLLLSFAACGPAVQPLAPAPTATAKPTAAPLAEAPSDSIDIDSTAFGRIDADVVYLASPELAGRGTGEPGARLAAEMIRNRFQQLGLRPAGDIIPPAHATVSASSSYFQRFQAKVGAKADTPQLSIQSGRNKPSKMTSVVADGASDATVKGSLVFVGYGITAAALGWDDYAGKDIEGKIAVVLAGAPRASKTNEKIAALHDFGSSRYKIRTAREHKAAGVILVTDASALPDPPTDPSGMGLPAATILRADAAKWIAGVDLKGDKVWDADKAATPKDLPKLTAELTTHVEALTADSWNILGALPAREGSPHASEWVVVGAHYDHLGMGGQYSRAPGKRAIHPGADDNASGTALVLEVAYRLAHLGKRPARNVLFASFGAEEIGLIGSRWWIDHPTIPAANIVAMINADMVGRMRDRQLLVDGVSTANEWPGLVKAASAGLRLDITNGGEGYGASDHATFTGAKIPVAFLFTGVHADYHMPSDTADKINVDGISVTSVLAARLATSVAEQDQRMAFVEPPSDPHKMGRGGFKVSLGTLPDYAYQGPGLKLTGVRPDSPASRAGLGAGDVIVKVDKHAITNIHDYMFALGELEPGKKTTVEVERAGKKITLDVIPAPGQGGEPRKDLPPNHP